MIYAYVPYKVMVMPLGIDKPLIQTIVPKVTIANPKNKTGIRKGKDISDHYPIIITGFDLKIISYNLQFMPLLLSKVEGKNTLDDITQAMHEIIDYFETEKPDVCCIQELFDNTANELMEAEMLQKGYVASDRVGSKSLPIFNGGVRTFVKKELATQGLTTYEHVYKNKIDYFIGGDALVKKGITHTCFNNTDGTKSHIFNTHLQAYYPDREHYAEVTLAQCVEFKKFIEDQKAKGIIGSNDKIMMCGDFNIPKPNSGEEALFLFEKMKRLLGPQFTFLDYNPNPEGLIHTLSHDNSYNKKLPLTIDMNVNVDMAIQVDPRKSVGSTLVDAELSDIYCDIQLAISHYVRRNATLFSTWLLAEDKIEELRIFNEQYKALMESADLIKSDDKNPIDNQEWLAQALNLLSGHGKTGVHTANPLDEPNSDLQESSVLPDEDTPLENLDQCSDTFNLLMRNLKQFHAEVHKNYIDSPDYYKKSFETSLKLNHVLLNAGEQFFNNPNAKSFLKFQNICNTEFQKASAEFEKNASFWSRLSPIFKNFLGLLAAISVLPALLIATKSSQGFTHTFFSPPPAKILTEIKENFEKDSILNPRSLPAMTQ
jgi:exonuclease III